MELHGKVALVTGASRGIGAATAEALAAAGAHVVLTARTEGGLIEVEEQIHERGGTATIAPLDLRDHDAVDRLAAALTTRWGRLDVLLLGAATLGHLTPVAHVEAKDWEHVLALNLTANWRLIRAFDPLLRASAAGRLLTLTSTVATEPRAYWGPYAASKAALDTLVLTYGAEVSNTSGVRVAVVNPGATRTRMRAKAYPGEDEATVKPPSAVGDALVALLQDDFVSSARVDLRAG